MKTLATLASDQPGRKRRRGGDDDTFGANDDDWGVYRTVQTGDASGDEDENHADEELGTGLRAIEDLLLEHDPEFSTQHTLAAQSDWRASLVHAFLRGPRPFDAESAREAHQLHLNVERIRVPEVLFQPGIAGLDQAGVIEITANLSTLRLGGGGPGGREEAGARVLRDVFLTGGNTLFEGFEARLARELAAVLPIDAVLTMRRARDARNDAWRGAAMMASAPGLMARSVTRDEYAEKGSEYLKVSFLGDFLPGVFGGKVIGVCDMNADGILFSLGA